MKYYHIVQKGESKVDFYFYLQDGKLHIWGSAAKGELDPIVQRRLEEICHDIGCTYESVDTGDFMNQIVLTRIPQRQECDYTGYVQNPSVTDDDAYFFLQHANEVSDHDIYWDMDEDSRFDEVELYVGKDGTIKTTSDYDDLYDEPVIIDRPNASATSGTNSSPYPTRRRKFTTAEGMLLGPAFEEPDSHRTDDFFSRTEETTIVVSGFFHSLDIREIRPKEDSKAVQRAREKGEEPKKRSIITGHIVDDNNSLAIKYFTRPSEDGQKLLKVLKSVGKVQVKGNVMYDEKFVKDYVLNLHSVRPVEEDASMKRVDDREDTRVELHLHTKMSEKNALVAVKDIVNRVKDWGHSAVAITDHGVVQAFPEAQAYSLEKKVKILYGVEAYLIETEDQKVPNHVIIFAKNMVGLRNLYKMISISHLNYFDEYPRLPRTVIENHREGILLGTSCKSGELIQAIVHGATDEELQKIAEFYDYLEIQPHENYKDFIKEGLLKTEEDLRDINRRIVALGDTLQMTVVATGNVHYMDPKDKLYREIMLTASGVKDPKDKADQHMRTTDEMLEEFAYLGEDVAYQVVVINTKAIEESIDNIIPIPNGTYSPKIEGADKALEDMCYAKAKSIYGDPLPKTVQDRLDYELKSIIGNGFGVLYYIAHKLVKKSLDDGYLVGSRGSVGSSFVATMADITEVNPLEPHYVCPECKWSEFYLKGEYAGGFDLPRRNCPDCGTPLIANGHDIPFAIFMGFHGDKVPDIDLNFSGDYQGRAHKYTEELFGRDNVFRAGTIGTIADKTAIGYAYKYADANDLQKRRGFIEKLSTGFTKVKNTTGQHPGGIMVCPRDMDVHHFTPVQYPANKKESGIITTHFDYHSIEGRMTKLDILGHDDPTIIRMLEDMTGIPSTSIPFDDPATLSLFSSTKALGLTPAQLQGDKVATLAVPESGTGFVRAMLEDSKPQTFSDLVRISGFSHGTNVWVDNAQTLIKTGTCKLNEAISTRDDIMNFLRNQGVADNVAFSVMENVRKGKGIEKRNKEGIAQTNYEEQMREAQVPEWFIASCKKISYLFPRAHAVAYVMMAFRIAWYKINYPLAFYASYFSIRAKAFDLKIMMGSLEEQQQEFKRLKALADKYEASQKEKDLMSALEVSLEMKQRGYSFANVELYKSQARRFMIKDETSLLPPFVAVTSLGEKVADAIVAEREQAEFLSIKDLRRRTKMSQTIANRMVELGCLGDLPEDEQMSLFG